MRTPIKKQFRNEKTELFILLKYAILSTEDKTPPWGTLYCKVRVLQGKQRSFLRFRKTEK